MPSIMGAPYVGEGMNNINQPGAVQGDWSGTLSFWNDSIAVAQFKKKFPTNPFEKGYTAYEMYEKVG